MQSWIYSVRLEFIHTGAFSNEEEQAKPVTMPLRNQTYACVSKADCKGTIFRALLPQLFQKHEPGAKLALL